MNNVIEPLVTVAGGVIGLAIIAVIVSKNARTADVIGATGSSFANILSAASAPVTGMATAPNVGGPNSLGLNLPAFGNGGLMGFGLGA